MKFFAMGTSYRMDQNMGTSYMMDQNIIDYNGGTCSIKQK